MYFLLLMHCVETYIKMLTAKSEIYSFFILFPFEYNLVFVLMFFEAEAIHCPLCHLNLI